MSKTVKAVVLLLLVAGCATRSHLTGDRELSRFAFEVGQMLEAHRWQEIIGVADQTHYRTQVVEHGMAEPQYIAELFALHHVDNNIKRGERLTWDDLARIRSVNLESLSQGPPHRLSGTVMTRDGETLRLEATIVESEDGRYRLTGGVG
jgi:hypothetical protein